MIRYRFGNFELDVAAYKLLRDGDEVPLRPKAFDLLHYLIEHREHVVSRRELEHAVWGGAATNSAAVSWTISVIRTVLGQKRGASEPIQTVLRRGYRFVGSVLHVPRAASSPKIKRLNHFPVSRPAGPFVGRSGVMARLHVRLQEAQRGRGHVCLLYGEPGMGKTRCAQELMPYARELGFSVWRGRSLENAGEPAFWPWMKAVRCALTERPSLRRSGSALLERLATTTPASADAVSRADRDPSAERFWLLDDVARFTIDAARAAPVLVFIDDLQWADTGSLDLLSFLAPQLSAARVLIVGALRESPLDKTQRALRRIAQYSERVQLCELSVADVHEYLRELVRAEPSVALATAVQRAAAGNPLFVRETVRALLAEHGATGLPALSPSSVKTSELARNALSEPLQSLSAEARRALDAASVLGEHFELHVLQRMVELPPRHLLDLIGAALSQGLVVAGTPQRYSFSRALVRELVYADVPAAERVTWHRKAAETLEALSSIEPRYAEIANHYRRSVSTGSYDHAVGAPRRPTEAAEAVRANADAV